MLGPGGRMQVASTAAMDDRSPSGLRATIPWCGLVAVLVVVLALLAFPGAARAGVICSSADSANSKIVVGPVFLAGPFHDYGGAGGNAIVENSANERCEGDLVTFSSPINGDEPLTSYTDSNGEAGFFIPCHPGYCHVGKPADINASDAIGLSLFAEAGVGLAEEEEHDVAKVEVGNVSADAAGSGAGGTIYAAKYPSDPTGTPRFATNGEFFTVAVSPVNDFAGVAIVVCGLPIPTSGDAIQWESSPNNWVKVKPQYFETPSAGCITADISATPGFSTPELWQLDPPVFTVSVPASPGPGEYGQCVAQKKGRYFDAKCQTLDIKNGQPKGKYEWTPGPAATCVAQKKGKYSESNCETLDEKKGKPKGSFEKQGGPGYTSAGGEATLATLSLGVTVKCAGSNDVGKVTGDNTDLDTITFTGCEASGDKCTSLEGATVEGEIVTYGLETTLIKHGGYGLGGLEPALGEVWTEYSNTSGAHAPYLAEFECAGLGYFRTEGWFSGVTTGDINTMSVTSQTVFDASVGEQGLETESSSSPTFESPTGPDGSTETTTASTTSASAIEIKG